MKKFLLIFLTLLLYLSSFAQPFQSIFGKEKTVFRIFTTVTCFDPDPDQLGCGFTYNFVTTPNDTISMNGVLYHFFNPNHHGAHGEGYIREDTMTGKIYRYYPELKEEFLMCDMTLNVGDTFIIPWGEQPAVVKQIDTIDGRKIIVFHDINSGDYWLYNGNYLEKNIFMKFIEGVGPIYGPLGFLMGYTGGESYMGVLLCIHRDDSLYYMTSELLGCNQFGANIDENLLPTIKIFPNPANDLIRIEIDDNIMGGKLLILNSIGMVVYQGTVHNNSLELNISHFPAGIYSVLYDTPKERIVSKFIK